jgi:hypothetical protein
VEPLLKYQLAPKLSTWYLVVLCSSFPSSLFEAIGSCNDDRYAKRLRHPQVQHSRLYIYSFFFSFGLSTLVYIKVKLSLCLTKYQAVKVYGGVDV